MFPNENLKKNAAPILSYNLKSWITFISDGNEPIIGIVIIKITIRLMATIAHAKFVASIDCKKDMIFIKTMQKEENWILI